MRTVIIGTGPAGVMAAETLRRLDASGRISALSAEPYPPYSPPAMADHFLTGREQTLYWKGADILERLGVDERRESIVAAIDCDNREIVLEDDERIGYEALIIASGSRLHAPIPGADLPGVLDFKSLRTAKKLIERVRSGEASTAIIVGAGLIGVELSLLLAELGVSVTVIEKESWVMPRVLDRETAAVVESALFDRGVDLRLGVGADEFQGDPVATGVRLGSGEVASADLLIAATGVRPHTEFLQGSSVAASWGVQVDDYLRTSVEGIYAAGDVAEVADLLSGEKYVHAIFPNAVTQGRIAAANALGMKVRYDGAESMNSLKHLGVPVVAIGTIRGADDVIRAGKNGSILSLYLLGDRIVGAQLAGDTRAAGLYRSLILRKASIRRYRERIESGEFSLADPVFSWPVRPKSSFAPMLR